ncbi:MAG: GxGYxYP family putative glycoside hydrolase [Bacteroidales bacterium]|nr:GxGYxYP family putative glycoside hydrolase [Bacteroidales bacterium]
MLSLRNSLALLAAISANCLLFNCANAQTSENKFSEQFTGSHPKRGISWPINQAFPHFALPARTIDGLSVAGKTMSSSEKIMWCALQGIVNREKPRIFLFETPQEGKYKWPDLLNLNISEFKFNDRLELLKKYKNEIKGLVLYSAELSQHYQNLASTIAGIQDCLPVTNEQLELIKAAGIDLPVVTDISNLKYKTPAEVYQYLYENYWDKCSKRLLVSLNPRMGYIRDLAVASKAAVVWLDPRKSVENTVIRKFLKDMTAGESIITGWWAEERSGIGVGVEYGISTVPSDFYENATVYAGMDHKINIPSVPKMPKLENKVYLAIFLSDGDNIQYCQHALSGLWDNQSRGDIPINWTVSPALADLGPGLLNYYYKTATDNDFFASGPSGLGYALIYDSHNRVWNTDYKKDFEPYSKLTQRYLERSGLRVITVWDEVNRNQMEAYSENCRYLYGVTQQDWEKRDKLKSVEINERLAFIPNLPCYAEDVSVIHRFWKDEIAAFDGKKPLFLSAQGKSWEMGPDNIIQLKELLNKLSPGNIVICRGDHFFNLYNRANKLSFNLTMLDNLKITTSKSDTKAELAADGSCNENNRWISSKEGERWIKFDFKKPYIINRYVVRQGSIDDLDKSHSISSFVLEVSNDGKIWRTVDDQSENKSIIVDVDIDEAAARYARVLIKDNILNNSSNGKVGKNNVVGSNSNFNSSSPTIIGDVEIYGKEL